MFLRLRTFAVTTCRLKAALPGAATFSKRWFLALPHFRSGVVPLPLSLRGVLKISSLRNFPAPEYDNMINSLSRYAQAVQANLPEPGRTTELALILDALETAVVGAGRKARDWPTADALHDLLVQCVVRRKGQAEFSDAVTDMLASVQAYEIVRGDYAGPRPTKKD